MKTHCLKSEVARRKNVEEYLGAMREAEEEQNAPRLFTTPPQRRMGKKCLLPLLQQLLSKREEHGTL